MDLNEALRSLDLKDLWKSEEYEKEILDDINSWLEEQTYIQDFIESFLRSEE